MLFNKGKNNLSDSSKITLASLQEHDCFEIKQNDLPSQLRNLRERERN